MGFRLRSSLIALAMVVAVIPASFAQDAYVEALAGYCAQESPGLVLFAQAPDTRLVAPRLAGRLGAGVVMR